MQKDCFPTQVNLFSLVMINGPASREEPFFHYDRFKGCSFPVGLTPTPLPVFVSLAATNKIYPDQAFADSEILEISDSCKLVSVKREGL